MQYCVNGGNVFDDGLLLFAFLSQNHFLEYSRKGWSEVKVEVYRNNRPHLHKATNKPFRNEH